MKNLISVVYFLLLSTFIPVHAQEVIAEKNPSDLNSKIKHWGMGLSFGTDSSLGLQLFRKLDSSWTLELAGTTRSSNCCAGDNPNSQVPYGYEIKDLKKNSLSLLLSKSFPIGGSDAWSFFTASGVGLVDTSSRAQFYNKTWIGYDLNSPAGSETVQQRRIIVPGQLGFRRADLKIFSQPMPVSFLIDFPLNGSGEPPSYRTPGGQTVKASADNFQEGSFKLQADILF